MTSVESDFEVDWEQLADAERSWRWDSWHFSNPVTVLTHDLSCAMAGRNRAFIARGVPVAGDSRRINGYVYVGMRAPSPEDPRPLDPLPQPPREGNHEAWDHSWLPTIQNYLQRWEDFDRESATALELADHFEESREWLEHCWEIHFRLDFGLVEWVDWCQTTLGWSAERARELSAGLMNKSIESDDALRELTELVRQSDVLREVFALAARDVLSNLPTDGTGETFRTALSTFLDRFGRRSDDIHELAVSSWREDPTSVLSMIKMYMIQPGPDQIARQVERAQRGAELEAQAREDLSRTHPELVATFETELQRARRCAALMEDHNYWIDQQTSYWMRMNSLAAGRHLQAKGFIDNHEDVFDLSFDEVMQALRGGSALQSVVARRRADREQWARMAAPLLLGTSLPEEVTASIAPMFGNSVDTSSAAQVRGQAASRGIVVGRARVIQSLEEAERLLPGEILVTKTTSPPWTPLFGVAGGIVTDAGGALSHAAVVAREYGIPAVVGAVSATERIRDGQLIRVDGGTGRVDLVVAEH